MKNKRFNRYLLLCLGIVVAAAVIAIALCVGAGNTDDESTSSSGGVDEPEITYTEVRVLEKKSDDAESDYLVGAQLNATDFSSIGQELASELDQELEDYYALTEVQRISSSAVWGLVSLHKDNWNECETAIGLALDNPLESMEWLNKAYDFGKSAVDSSKRGRHIEIRADASLSLHNVSDKPHTITVVAGYGYGNLTITLDATICAEDRLYQTGGVYNGYATFEEEITATGSDIPALIVTPIESNNNGYYSEDYYGPTAFWVQNDVFYNLRVHGAEADKEMIEYVLRRILEEI